MALGAPLWLLGWLVVPLVAWLVWRYKRPMHLLVSSVILWRKLPDAESPARRRWQLILSMLCYVLFAVLLVLALAQPAIYVARTVPRRVIILMDNSISMGSFVSDTGRTRLSVAQDKIEAALGRLSQRDTVSIIHLQGAVNGLDKQSAVKYLKDIKLSGTGGDFDSLIKQVAPSITAENKKGGLVLIICSDKMPPDEALGLLPASRLFILVGAPSNNKAIIQANASPSPGKPGMVDIFAMVRNYSGVAAGFPAELYDNEGKMINSVEVNVPAGGRYPLVFPGVPADQKIYKIRINISDELMCDNEALVQAGEKGLKVCFIGTKNQAVLKALEAVNGAGQVNHINYDKDAVFPASEMGGYDLYVFNNLVPETLPKRSVLINPPDIKGAASELASVFAVAGAITPTGLSISDETSPLFTQVNLDNIYAKSAARLMINDRAHFRTLVKSKDDIIAGEFLKDGKYCLIIGFDVEWNQDSNWALMPSFPIFWANLVNKIRNEMPGPGPGAIYGEKESDNAGQARDDITQGFSDSKEQERSRTGLSWHLLAMACLLIGIAWITE
ncbi:MAG: BatA and WFA domain-containing protein [Planctomycetota bacterium]